MYLIAEFLEKEALVRGIRSLKQLGLSGAELDIFSEEPVELSRGILDRPSRMSLVTVLGAIATGSAATAFVYFAQHNYQITTGGMPIFSFWGTGVITYETTMLGSILASLLMFLWESGLIRKRDRTAPVPLVAPGSMCLRARCGPELVLRASELLERAGATHIERKVGA